MSLLVITHNLPDAQRHVGRGEAGAAERVYRRGNTGGNNAVGTKRKMAGRKAGFRDGSCEAGGELRRMRKDPQPPSSATVEEHYQWAKRQPDPSPLSPHQSSTPARTSTALWAAARWATTGATS